MKTEEILLMRAWLSALALFICYPSNFCVAFSNTLPAKNNELSIRQLRSSDTAFAPNYRRNRNSPSPLPSLTSKPKSISTLYMGALYFRDDDNKEKGIRAMQLLLGQSKRQQEELKSKIMNTFPYVPETVINPFVSVTSDMLKSITPDEIKKAIEPGGMEKVRSQLKKNALEQQIIQDLPLISDKDKTKVIYFIVDYLVDYILSDAEWLLASPETRLTALESQITSIKQEMGSRRLIIHRIKQRPKLSSIALLTLISTIYLQTQQQVFLANTIIAIKSICLQLMIILSITRKKIIWIFWSCQIFFKKVSLIFTE